MNQRLLNAFQNAVIAHVWQQRFSSTPRCPNSLSTFSFLTTLVPGNWFSTAIAAPGDDLRPGTAEAAKPAASKSPGGQRPPATAGNQFVASTPVSSSSPACPAPEQAASLPAAAPPQPQPRESHDAPPVIAVFEDEALAAQLRQPQPVQLLQAVPTPEGPSRDKLLVRDFIQNSLYHPTLGYFSSPTPPVGTVGSPINYWRIYCRDEFNILVSNKYREMETSFLTPAELFSPWYGACIARHMVEHRRHHLGMEGQPLLIVEVGGGNGTLARDILDWLRDNRPQDYRQTSYTCLEISTSLAARQFDKVIRQGGHGGRFHLRRGSGLDPATWGPERRWEHTFVLMMEVLDNLPHDRVFRRRGSDPWQQTVVCPVDDGTAVATTALTSAATPRATQSSASLERGPWQLVGEPLSDPLLCRTLAAVYRPPSREQQLDERFNRVLDFILARDTQPSSREEVLWLPTACAGFLELLHDLRPNHSLIAADFDKLPDVKLPGRNAPLVAQKSGGRNIDHDTLFVPWGTADIFFPTDFDALCALYRATASHVWGRSSDIAASSASAAVSPSAGQPSITSGNTSRRNSSSSVADHVAAAAAGGGDGGGGGSSVEIQEDDEVVGRGGDVNAEHFRQGAVIKRYREMFNTATICAFNPMVDDFINARFFFGDSKNRYPPGQERRAPQASKLRLPQAPPSLVTGIKAHIPAAPAAKVRARLQQQQQQGHHHHHHKGHQQQPPHHHHQPQQQQGHELGHQCEPVLGARRQRGLPNSSHSSSSNNNNSSSDSGSSSNSGSISNGSSSKGRGSPRR